jgi:GxxExxY protein
MDENEIGKVIVDSAVVVHKELGPGLLESVYEIILADELQKRNLSVNRQVQVPIVCRGKTFNEAFRADLVVEKKVIIELKSVENLDNSHKKQLLTYLKLTSMKLGFLLNFSSELMKDGIIRTVNGL